jgi:hypothetical protein
MTFEELKKEIELALPNKPKNWRYGQFVFNYIDGVYGAARSVQFIDHIDCFYDDKMVDKFIETSIKYIES